MTDIDRTQHIFLDTNTLLHFKRPDLLDWKAIVRDDGVILVVCPALIDELESIKVDPKRGGKLRERAHKAIMWISKLMDQPDPVDLTTGVQLTFIAESPTIDFAAHRLSYAVPDDQLIASAIQYRERTKARICFFSNDTGLRLKLRSRDITAFTLPISERLPDEPDEHHQELTAIRRQLARYETRAPVLTLSFDTGEQRYDFGRIPKPSAESLPSGPPPSDATLRQQRMEAQRTFVEDYEKWRVQAQLIFSCDLVVINKGTDSATNLNIDLTFSDDISLLAKDDLPKLPKPPRSGLDYLRPDYPDIVNITRHLRQRPPGQPYFSDSPHLISWEIPSLLHHTHLSLHTFFFRFANKGAVRRFSVPTKVICEELLDPIETELHFISGLTV